MHAAGDAPGTMVTPRPSPREMARMKRFRLVRGVSVITCTPGCIVAAVHMGGPPNMDWLLWATAYMRKPVPCMTVHSHVL